MFDRAVPYDERHLVAFVVVAIVALALCRPAAALALVAALAALAALAARPARRRFAQSCARCAQPAAKAPAPPAPGRAALAIPGRSDLAPPGGERARGAPYPGAVYPGDLEAFAAPGEPSERLGWDGDADREVGIGWGGEERWGADDDWGPGGDGMPWAAGRGAPGLGAPSCYDDEASAELDGDEALAVNATARNDAVRVTAGTMNRVRDLDRYLREEVEERESDVWWGRHEL